MLPYIDLMTEGVITCVSYIYLVFIAKISEIHSIF